MSFFEHNRPRHSFYRPMDGEGEEKWKFRTKLGQAVIKTGPGFVKPLPVVAKPPPAVSKPLPVLDRRCIVTVLFLV